MIAIRMRFLAGRLHSTPWGHHVNEGVVEYPPSLFRFLRSLVAVARRACLGRVSEEQLRRIVSTLALPPHFHLPQGAIGHTRHYDQANDGVKFFDTFVSVEMEADLFWIWPESLLDAPDRSALATLLQALGTFGRSESWCEASLLDEAEAGRIADGSPLINSKPLEQGHSLSGQETIRLLLPQEGMKAEKLLEVLETETSAMKKEKRLEPEGTRWLTYVRPAGILKPRRFQPPRVLREPRSVNVARYALDSTVLPMVGDSMPFAEQARRALIRNGAALGHSETITGKAADGSPLTGHDHAHYFATDEDEDGRIDHLTVYARCGFTRDEIETLAALRTIYRRDELPNVKLVLTGLGNAVEWGHLAIFDTHTCWRSVTPFSLPRFASRGAGKPPRPRDLPEAQLLRELKSRGLPEPRSIHPIEGYQTEKRPMVRWLEFHARRFNGTEGHGLAGFELEFAEPISGPLALGFGCHFGLGLFLPVKGGANG